MGRSDTPELFISGRVIVIDTGLASRFSDCSVPVEWVWMAPLHDNDQDQIWVGGPETCSVASAERGRVLSKTGYAERWQLRLENCNLRDVWLAVQATGDGVQYMARVQ